VFVLVMEVLKGHGLLREKSLPLAGLQRGDLLFGGVAEVVLNALYCA
jgi:hypothetical protein